MPIEQKEFEKSAMEQRLRFEEMLANISARLMAAPFDRVDGEIDLALRQTMEFFGVDRCALLEIREDKGFARITKAASGEGVEPVPGEINLCELFPWCYESLIHGQTVNIVRVEDYPEDALKDRQSHEAFGIKSALNIPMPAGGRMLRTIVINSTRQHRAWPEDYIPRLRLLGEILVNALDRREDRLKLEEQSRIEMLLVEISGRFINLPAGRVDSGIEDAQRRICELLDLDRSTLWQASEGNPGTMLLTHLFFPSANRAPPVRMNARDYFPWTTQKVLNGETVVLSNMAALPPEASLDRKNFLAYGTTSTAMFPLSVGEGAVFGLLAFAVTHEERRWTEAALTGFRLLAQVFANALVRKEIETALRESEARLSLTTEAVNAGLWIMSVDSRKVWVSAMSRELFHFAPDEEIHYESYFRVIHPEDRERVNQAVQQALRSGNALRCDYRIVLPDGAIRWITVRGQSFAKPNGEPDRMMGLSLDITERKLMEEQLKDRLLEIEALKQRLERENLYLQEEIKGLAEHSEIVGQSAGMKKVLSQAAQVAPTGSTVLILGETGTGKELLARAIHGMSSRKDRPLVTVNCASLPPTLIESELFGREKGAFTGALTRMAGRFEVADESTLFLDEIGEVPLELQSKLLRVLEEGTFERLGSTKALHVNVRIIAATNRNLEQDVKAGKFRRDLFYRLNVFPILIPPLRERPEDIPLLVRTFVKEFQKRMGKEIESIPKTTMQDLRAYSWPGNIRELRNLIEHAMIVSKGKTLDVHVPKSASSDSETTGNLMHVERMHIVAVLEKTGWRIAGLGGAAEVLGMKRTTLQAKLAKLGIKRSTRTVPK